MRAARCELKRTASEGSVFVNQAGKCTLATRGVIHAGNTHWTAACHARWPLLFLTVLRLVTRSLVDELWLFARA